MPRRPAEPSSAAPATTSPRPAPQDHPPLTPPAGAELTLDGDLFRALVEHATDGIALVDAAGIFRYMSPTATRMLGYEAGELLGRHVFELLHPEDQARAQEAFARVL